MTDTETFRHVIGHFASGVTVLTARHGGADFGATASAVSSLSLDPPMLLVCMSLRGSTQRAIQESRMFGVNILDEDQGQIAERFASLRGERFAGLNVELGGLGVPRLTDALAFCECHVVEDVTAGTHRVFLADVTRAVAREGFPLTYFRGRFGCFETGQDRTVHSELRRRILVRSISLDDPLDLQALAAEFNVLPGAVYRSVTKLVTDGFLERDPERGYVVRPVTLESSEQCFDARCAMELGAAASTVGRVPPDRLRALREIMAETLSLLADGRIVDIDVYARRNQEFHNAIIDLAANPVLSGAYRRLGTGGLTTSLLHAGSEVGQDIADDHQTIVEAYEQANLDAALAVITRHNDHVKQTIRQAILAGGGRL